MEQAPALHVLSGGAAQGLLRGLQPEFEAARACRVLATFGAVGAMRDALMAGAACDVLVLTQALIRTLGDQGQLLPYTARPLGMVQTGLAVRDRDAPRGPASPMALKAALEATDAVYLADTANATSGIHFLKMLRELGIAERLAPRLRTFPSGAIAMAQLAQATENRVLGCTQVTEILHAPGVQLAGLLPPPYELATVYTAAVCTRAEDPRLAATFIDLLAGESARPLRDACGFEPA